MVQGVADHRHCYDFAINLTAADSNEGQRSIINNVHRTLDIQQSTV